MEIAVFVRNERGDELLRMQDVAQYVPPPAPPPGYLPLVSVGDPRFPMLGAIDPYGDTCFNWVQCERLLVELDTVDVTKLGREGISMVRALRIMVAVQAAKPHRYLWFIGA